MHKDEYNNLVELLDDLIDEVGEEEAHPLANRRRLIEKYEDENVPELNI